MDAEIASDIEPHVLHEGNHGAVIGWGGSNNTR